MEGVKDYSQAVGFFCEHFQTEFASIVQYFEDEHANWTTMDLTTLEESIRLFVDETYQQLQEFTQEKESLFIALECIVYHNLHDIIMDNLYKKFLKEDEQIFKKSKRMNDISAVQFGASEDHAIALPASIVELASLDTFKTPTEKMKCLCTCYDLIFAELKMAMIEMIAESADEHFIPVVDNCEIAPVLMNVIIKAKLKHLHSNLYYLETYGRFPRNNNVMKIFEEFKFAYKKLCELEDNLDCKRISRELEMQKFYEILSEDWSGNSLQANQTRRFTHLITKSLSEHINN